MGEKKDCIMTKKQLEGRLELITEIDNIKFINDSRSCSVDAAKWALSQISGPILLIAGGRYRNDDYSGIMELVREKVKELILIGEAKDKLKEIFKDLTSLSEASSLEDAVNKAFKKASSGDCILLSPMCPSLDMFKDYFERGKVFKKAILKLTEK